MFLCQGCNYDRHRSCFGAALLCCCDTITPGLRRCCSPPIRDLHPINCSTCWLEYFLSPCSPHSHAVHSLFAFQFHMTNRVLKWYHRNVILGLERSSQGIESWAQKILWKTVDQSLNVVAINQRASGAVSRCYTECRDSSRVASRRPPHMLQMYLNTYIILH